jgi:hypothetical protein
MMRCGFAKFRKTIEQSEPFLQRFGAWRLRGDQGMSAKTCTKDKLKNEALLFV